MMMMVMVNNNISEKQTIRKVRNVPRTTAVLSIFMRLVYVNAHSGGLIKTKSFAIVAKIFARSVTNDRKAFHQTAGSALAYFFYERIIVKNYKMSTSRLLKESRTR